MELTRATKVKHLGSCKDTTDVLKKQDPASSRTKKSSQGKKWNELHKSKECFNFSKKIQKTGSTSSRTTMLINDNNNR